MFQTLNYAYSEEGLIKYLHKSKLHFCVYYHICGISIRFFDVWGGGAVCDLGVKCGCWKPIRIDELQTHFSFIYSESAALMPSTQDSEQWGSLLSVIAFITNR